MTTERKTKKMMMTMMMKIPRWMAQKRNVIDEEEAM